MAAMTFYDKFKENQLDGDAFIDFNTDTIKVMLTSSLYVPNSATDDFKNDVTNEVSGTNYTAGGVALTAKTVALAGSVVTFDAADATWLQSVTGFSNARYAVMYKDTGVAATSPLVGYLNFVTDKGNVSGDLVIQWSATGIFTLS
jgi:hypothetical protein